MSQRTALALSVGFFGGLAAFAFRLADLHAWAAFIAWACLIQARNAESSVARAIAGNLAGVFTAWVAVVVMTMIPSTGNFWMVRAFLTVGVTLTIMILASAVPLLSNVAASLAGFGAALAAMYFLPDATTQERVLHLGRSNPGISVAASMLLGAVVGLAAQRMEEALSRK